MCNAVVNSVVLLLMSYGVRLYKLCFEFKVSFSNKRYEELWLQNRVLGFKNALLSSIFGSNA